MNIKRKIMQLQTGDKIRVNDWDEIFTVCGVSENFVLAHHRQQYTIIGKRPADYPYNGIPVGAYVCSPDNLVFGFPGGYHFKDAAWVQEYLNELESGKLEMSLRNRAQIYTLERVPQSPERECCDLCQFSVALRHNFKPVEGFKNSKCCIVHADKGDRASYVLEVSPWDICEMFTRRADNGR